LEKSKLETYLGFCIRAGKIVFGAEMIERQKKGIKLLLADGSAGKNSLKPAINAKEKFACPLLMMAENVLGEVLHRPAVKVAAVTDEHLASAILSLVGVEPQLKLYSGGNN